MIVRTRMYLFLTLALVSMIPIVFFGIWPQSKALDNEIAEVSERHLLIAKNIRHALQRYDWDIRAVFRFLTHQALAGAKAATTNADLQDFEFRHVCIARIDNPRVTNNALADRFPCPELIPAKRFDVFRSIAEADEVKYTPVMEGPGGRPLIYLVMRLGDVLSVGAINTDYFVGLGKSIAFDKGGHAAIVDHIGQVLAHPRSDWIAARKNISKVAPVKLMLQGKSGVSEFYSPAAKKDMIAGYTSVPGPGWGVMIPQPMAELIAKANEVKLFAMGVILLGVAVAAFASWWLAGMIASPVSAVAQAAQAMARGKRGIRVQKLTNWVPSEFSELAQSFNEMATAVEDAMKAERETNADFSAIFAASPAATFLLDRENRFRLVSKMFENWFGQCEEEVRNHTPDEVFSTEIAGHLSGAFHAALQTRQPVDVDFDAEFSNRETRKLTAHVFPIIQADGEASGLGAIMVDTTAQKLAEERLQQAQKMESVGQLAGGVAHDFNNLLMVIHGNAELLFNKVGSDDKLVKTIVNASVRGAELSQRLLAFSRRQPLRPKSIDLAMLVNGMSELIRRFLGAIIEIEVKTEIDLWETNADPGQVENAILNLAINARDAMPEGGTLTIECSNVQLSDEYVARNPETLTGDYVKLSVSDSGFGMSKDVQKSAFEPFFTTKEVGAGSGLGLSMVYGFAKQSGGHVTISSKENQGTTVAIYLPRATASGKDEVRKIEYETPVGQGETVLVVEDDVDIRTLSVKMLMNLGYRTIDASDAVRARTILTSKQQIDLVLCDIVLPGGISGSELAELAQDEHPDLPFVFMSGYPADAAGTDALLKSKKILLNKPFRRHDLAVAIRDALAGS